MNPVTCPICESTCAVLDVVDFNKSCEEVRGKFLPVAGLPVHYYLCDNCGFCLAPEFSQWTLEDFERRIYNADYVNVDPDYLGDRPRANASGLINLFGEHSRTIRHIDYGGGNGSLSEILRETGWNSVSYDPFVNRNVHIESMGRFDLITAYEVFEHVPDVKQLMSNLSSLLASDGVVLFSTLLTDGNIGPRQPLSWWYASPRNGHISLFSDKSLVLLAAKHGLKFGSFDQGLHVFWYKAPPWAQKFLKDS